MDPSVISAGAAVQEREGDKNLVQAGDKCCLTVWHQAQPRVQSSNEGSQSEGIK